MGAGSAVTMNWARSPSTTAAAAGSIVSVPDTPASLSLTVTACVADTAS